MEDLNDISKKINNHVLKNKNNYIKQMVSKTKWYKKIFKKLYNYRFFYILCFSITLFYSITTNDFSHLFTFMSAYVMLYVSFSSYLSIDEAFIKVASKLCLLDMINAKEKYLDSLQDETISLETIKSLSSVISEDEFKKYFNSKKNNITYFHIFGKLISEINEDEKKAKEIADKNNKKLLKEKNCNELIKSVYEEKIK